MQTNKHTHTLGIPCTYFTKLISAKNRRRPNTNGGQHSFTHITKHTDEEWSDTTGNVFPRREGLKSALSGWDSEIFCVCSVFGTVWLRVVVNPPSLEACSPPPFSACRHSGWHSQRQFGWWMEADVFLSFLSNLIPCFCLIFCTIFCWICLKIQRKQIVFVSFRSIYFFTFSAVRRHKVEFREL